MELNTSIKHNTLDHSTEHDTPPAVYSRSNFHRPSDASTPPISSRLAIAESVFDSLPSPAPASTVSNGPSTLSDVSPASTSAIVASSPTPGSMTGVYSTPELVSTLTLNTPAERKALEDFKVLVEKNSELIDQGLSIVDLYRFLVARQFNLTKAHTMIVNYIRWRAHAVPPEGVPAGCVANMIRSSVAFFYKHDKHGRPAIYIRSRNHLVRRRNINEFKLWVLYLLETLTSRLMYPAHSFAFIFDFSGLSLANMDLTGFRVGLGILLNNYPERLGACYMLHTGWVFSTMWKIINPLLDERTRRKILMPGKNWKQVLRDNWNPEDLLEEYGGDDPYVFDNDPHRFDEIADVPEGTVLPPPHTSLLGDHHDDSHDHHHHHHHHHHHGHEEEKHVKH
eukprot:GILI01011300.1.p1 GENE.GILI01011300.1~~GILI01011300.1.p1  ORF type:complete len:394 (+),score=52.98 GILI01011300.1:152-1333(+)